jgi:hypothetical protein
MSILKSRKKLDCGVLCNANNAVTVDVNLEEMCLLAAWKNEKAETFASSENKKSQLESREKTSQIPSRLFLRNLTESAECPERLALFRSSTLKHNLRRRANKVHPPLLHLLLLGPHTNRPLPFGADNNTRALDAFESHF